MDDLKALILCKSILSMSSQRKFQQTENTDLTVIRSIKKIRTDCFWNCLLLLEINNKLKSDQNKHHVTEPAVKAFRTLKYDIGRCLGRKRKKRH